MVKRIFLPANEWLYYKIYCGVKTSDEILTDVILPFANELLIEKKIDKWFFIRYADPEQHLRIRFHFMSGENLGYIMQQFNIFLKEFIDADKVWKVMLDTYHRELERYNENAIELAEDLFFADSNFVVSFLNLIEGNEGEIIRWMVAFKSIDSLLHDFEFTLEEKLYFMEERKKSFAIEFGMDKYLKHQLDKKYRAITQDIITIMELNRENAYNYLPIMELLEERTLKNKEIRKNLNINNFNKKNNRISELLTSYVHMLMNRHFRSKQRMYEMIVYDFLWRYYRSQKAKLKNLINK